MTLRFLTGSYAQADENGVCLLSLDTDTEQLTLEKAWQGFINPSYVIADPSGKKVFLVEELCPTGNVVSALLEDHDLSVRSRFSSFGADPCHLCLWPDGQTLVASNYTSGSFSVYHAAEDATLTCSQTEQYAGGSVNLNRQECAHIHFSAFQKDTVYLVDLGSDRVYLRRPDLSNGKIADQRAVIQLPPGSGPRHLAYGENGVVYIVSELQNQVYVYQETEEGYQLLQVCDTTAAPSDGLAAAIRYADHRLFVSNRGEDSIVLYETAPDGRLTFLDRCPSGGRIPRDFAVSGRHLIVCNQDSSLLTLLRLNEERTRLEPTEISFALPRPTCVCLL